MLIHIYTSQLPHKVTITITFQGLKEGKENEYVLESTDIRNISYVSLIFDYQRQR